MMRTIAMALLLITCTSAMAQTSQETGFTYQGRLSHAGIPAQGNLDMTFALFDAPAQGNQIGTTLLFTAANGNPVAVDSGVFDVTLDFGILAFIAPITEQRFLAVSVNGELLTPRTPIENAPYALQSQTAELAYTVTNSSIGAAQIDATQVQRRVGGSCVSGSSIQAVNPDGTVSCQASGTGTITGVTAGSGLSGGGTSGVVALNVDTAIMQSRVSGSCAIGSSIRAVSSNGTVICEPAGSGTITGITAGSGLTGGGTSGNVALAIQPPLLLNSSAFSTISVSNENSNGVGIYAESNGEGIDGRTLGTSGTGVTGVASATTGTATAVSGTAYADHGTGVRGFASSSTGQNVGVSGSTNSSSGYGIYGSNGKYAVYGLTFSAAGSGIRGEETDASGYGVSGSNPNGTGVYGSSTSGSGVFGSTSAIVSSSPTAGVVGLNSANGFGVYGKQTAGPGGAGVYGIGAYAGVWGYSATSIGTLGQTDAGTGVVGNAFSGVGTSGNSNYIGVFGGGNGGVPTYGVFGTGGTGVYGTSASNSGYGTYGYASGSAGQGVRGELAVGVTNGFGTVGYSAASSGTGNGVYGQSNSPGGVGVSGYSGPGIGVAGSTSSGLAGKFIGNVQVIGTLSKSAGSFQIDHPLDPANKYLFHSFVESPDMKNIYDGIATLDGHGEAWVEMPEYFEALNQDFRYQLTALDQPGPSLYVSQRISGNRFKLAGGAAGAQVSWQVTGTRHDAYAQAHRIEVEVNKTGSDRGKYLHPAAFGLPQSTAIAPVVPPAQDKHDVAKRPKSPDTQP